MSATMTDKEILELAADIKESMGHAQHYFGDGRTEVCMASALMLATGEEASGLITNPRISSNRRVVEIGNRFFGHWMSICEYNNEHTKEECVDKFRELAKSA